jgi:hypothetical protein
VGRRNITAHITASRTNSCGLATLPPAAESCFVKYVRLSPGYDFAAAASRAARVDKNLQLGKL